MEKMCWIICEGFSQDWGFTPTCFYTCSKDHNPDDKDKLDRFAIKVVGDDPAEYGYVKIEGEGNVFDSGNAVAICADTEEDLSFIYNRVADSFLLHPGVIDLRKDGKTVFRLL